MRLPRSAALGASPSAWPSASRSPPAPPRPADVCARLRTAPRTHRGLAGPLALEPGTARRRRSRRARHGPGAWTPRASRSCATASSSATGTGRLERDVPREVFSITKSVTSTLVGIAIRDGDLRLDDTRRDLRPGVARHSVGVGDRAQPALQRQRPVLVAAVRLRRPARRAEPHEVRRRPDAAVRPRQRLGLQQRGDPGRSSRCWRRPPGCGREVRPHPPLHAARHDPLQLHHRPGRRRGGVLRPADHLPRPGPVRLALPRQGQGRRHAAARRRATSGARSDAPRPRTMPAYGYLWWLNRPGRLRGATDPVDAQGSRSRR